MNHGRKALPLLASVLAFAFLVAGSCGRPHQSQALTEEVRLPAASEVSLKESLFSDMLYLRDSTSARVSSWDRSGANVDFRNVPAGATLELANIAGAGCIRHIYFTIMTSMGHIGDSRYLRDLVLRAYWDGEAEPSIETPFGDFFGQGHGCIRYFRSLMVTVNEGAEIMGGNAPTLTVGFNCYFPMPFSNGARLTLTNDGDADVGAVWYHIDYEVMGSLEPGIGRFHAQWRRQNPTSAIGDAQNPINVTMSTAPNLDGKENYVILDAEGHGNFVGYFLNVHNFFNTWYGEGDDMVFIDGLEWPPAIHGTGTEECFGGGACPSIEYSGPYTGFQLVGNKDYAGKTSMYRFYVADPLRFRKSIKVTIEHGHANNFANDYSSTAFWYQAEPHAPFPALPPAEQRRPVAGDDPHDRAAAGFQRLQANRGRYAALLHEKHVEASAEIEDTVMRQLIPEIAAALSAHDYAAAAEKCQSANELIEKFLDEHD